MITVVTSKSTTSSRTIVINNGLLTSSKAVSTTADNINSSIIKSGSTITSSETYLTILSTEIPAYAATNALLTNYKIKYLTQHFTTTVHDLVKFKSKSQTIVTKAISAIVKTTNNGREFASIQNTQRRAFVSSINSPSIDSESILGMKIRTLSIIMLTSTKLFAKDVESKPIALATTTIAALQISKNSTEVRQNTACNFDPNRVPFTKNDRNCLITEDFSVFQSKSKVYNPSIGTFVFRRLPSPHKGAAEAVRRIVASLGCLWLIGILGFTLLAFSLLRVWDLERILQMNLEISLLLAHIVIFTTSEVKDLELCRMAVGLLHYFFMVNGLFFLFESLHIYSVITNMISKRAMASRLLVTFVGWFIPAIATIASIPFIRDSPSSYACWFHFEKTGVTAAMGGAILIPPYIGIILAEIANMDLISRPVPLGSKAKKTSAIIANSGNTLLVPISTINWFLGSYTMYSANLGLYLVAFAGNITLGVMYFMFHAMENSKLRRLIHKLFACCPFVKSG